jgi:hypothetical protein
MLEFTSKFPYITYRRILKPEDFITITMNSEELSLEQKNEIKAAKELLTFQGIPLNKVRFVFERTFTYDVDADIVNPKYTVLQPKKKFKKAHPVEIGKPVNFMTISVGLYQTDHDNYESVKKIIKGSKRGVVINLGFASLDYTFLMANLDNAVDFYKNSPEFL